MLLMFLFAFHSALAAAPSAPPPVVRAAPVQPAADTAANPEKCQDLSPRLVDEPGAAPLRRLDELPPGRLELTVLRQVQNCAIPAVVREGIGRQADEVGPQATGR